MAVILTFRQEVCTCYVEEKMCIYVYIVFTSSDPFEIARQARRVEVRLTTINESSMKSEVSSWVVSLNGNFIV